MNLQTAITQAVGQAYFMDVKNGGRYLTALEKAIEQVRKNKSINFDGTVLTFTSLNSGKQRKVTKFGCVADACDCGNQISYHKALFQIMSKLDDSRVGKRFRIHNKIYKGQEFIVIKDLVNMVICRSADETGDNYTSYGFDVFTLEYYGEQVKWLSGEVVEFPASVVRQKDFRQAA